jgi:Flp pilus assembly protein TadG
MSRTKKRQKGSVLVEYGLVFLLFFTTVYAIIEFGRYVYVFNVIAGATREGARYAIVHGSTSGAVATQADITTRVRSWALGLDSSALNVTVTWTPGNTPGSKVRVQSAYNLLPMSHMIFRTGLSVTSRSEMVISQ